MTRPDKNKNVPAVAGSTGAGPAKNKDTTWPGPMDEELRAISAKHKARMLFAVLRGDPEDMDYREQVLELTNKIEALDLAADKTCYEHHLRALTQRKIDRCRAWAIQLTEPYLLDEMIIELLEKAMR